MKKLVKEVEKIEVVINRCYGGFGLSHIAVLNLFDAGCSHIKTMHLDKYFEKDSCVSRADHLRLCNIPTRNDLVFLDEHGRSAEDRTCSHLIAVVRELGTNANGQCAKLKIVKVPGNVNFSIDDYDGLETLEEVHRSWC
jgi:hypothetical protein